ncbi:IniB N-terminal domain-containing protein [Paractinoplanes globisporus]|uniref:IniB N-terminal domain-containing protein n=1 Tax=Paractinoplanes globisporus TaxID=113565 RepID=A0ABW6WIF4_9ACTN|nr:IniB N-terminal domain-containing protein [Actinoplanes globisporus]
MEFSPTLQDFVLNLIYDPGARSAFELDPHGTLEAAGLGDVTAADVRDVLPLVLDNAPDAVHAPAGLSPVDDVTAGVAHLDVVGAVSQLQAITAQVGGGLYSHATSDLNIAAAGTMTADHLVSGVVSAGVGMTGGLDLNGLGGLDLSHDPAAGLDSAVHTPLEHTNADVSYGVDGLDSHAALTGTLDTTVNATTGLTGSLGIDAGGLDVSGLHEATSSVAGDLSGVDHTVGGLLPDGTVDSATGVIDHHVSSVTGLLDGVTHPAPEPATEAGHDVLGGLTGLHF